MNRLCVEYEGEDVIPKLPNLKPGEKLHRIVAHDETCVHANDQSLFVWERDNEHELRKKERGRLVHMSGFILEECGSLKLTDEETKHERLLPKRPLSPAQLAEVARCEVAAQAVADAAARKQEARIAAGGKPRKSKAKKPADTIKETVSSRAPVATDRTAEGLEWTPPPPPAPHTRYQCETFDAQRIIHPGKGHDPYWDMPQLIAQVSTYLFSAISILIMVFRPRMLLISSRPNTLMMLRSSFLIVPLHMKHLPVMRYLHTR